MAEGDADPGAGVGDLRHGMLPGPLCLAAGDQQVAVSERERPRATATARAKEETAGFAERHERDDRLVDALGNLVPVPGDAVLPVPVEIEPGGVEPDAVAVGEGGAHLLQEGWLERRASAGMPPGGEPWLDPVLLVEEAGALRPGKRLSLIHISEPTRLLSIS